MGQREYRTSYRAPVSAAAVAALLALLTPGCNDSENSDHENSSLPERFVWACEDTSLWQIAAWKDAVVRNLTLSEPARKVAVDDGHGSVWLASADSLYRFSNDGSLELSLSLSDFPQVSETDGNVSALAADKRDGTLWVAKNRRVFKFSPAGDLLLTHTLGSQVEHLSLDIRKGLLWAAGSKQVVALATASAEQVRQLPLNSGGAIRDVAFDQHMDSLWVGQERQLSLFSSAGTFLHRFDVPPFSQLSPDGRGRVWLAHDRRLYRYDATGLQDLALDSKQLDTRVRGNILAIGADVNDARLWILTRHGLGVIASAAEGAAVLNEMHPPGCLGLSGDVNVPTVTFHGLSADDLVSPVPDIGLGFSDIGVGVDLDTIELSVNGEPVGVECQFHSPTSATCKPDSPFTDPSLALEVTIQDRALNLSSKAAVAVKLDTDGDGLADDVDPETDPFEPPGSGDNPNRESAEQYLKNYGVYHADVNGDGFKDIFLRPRPEIILLTLDDILFPANINRQPGFWLKATNGWGGYQQPELWEGPLPAVSGAGELGVFTGNTDTDLASAEMLVQPSDAGTSGVVLSYDGAQLSLLDELELGLVDGLDISSGVSTLQLTDNDDDGRDDLHVTNILDGKTEVIYAHPDGTFGSPLNEEDIALAELWFSFLNAMKDGHPSEAALYFREDRRGDYQRVFDALHEELPTIAADFRYFKRVQGNEDYAVYAVNRLIKGHDRLFFVSFTKDSEGNWKMVAL